MKRLFLSTMYCLSFFLICAAPQSLFADGNVLAYFETDDFGFQTALVIEGDNEDNHIRVTLDDASHVVIEGLNGTTINGLSSDELTYTSSINGIPIAKIDLGNGDDTLEHLFTSDSFHYTDIVTGNGNDSVSISEFARTGLIDVDTGIGNDEVSLYFASDVFFSAGYEVATGPGLISSSSKLTTVPDSLCLLKEGT